MTTAKPPRPPIRPTIRTVAERAGVSVATVSRVVNGLAPPESDATRKVRAAIEDLGFRPSRLGRSLKTARTSTIGLVIPSIANPVFAGCVEAIQAAARAEGYAVLLTSTDYDPAEEEGAVEALLSHSVDGLVLTVAKADGSALLDRLDARAMPYVLLFNQPAEEGRAAVSVDNVAAAREAVESLARAGHRRIGMVAGRFASSDRARLRWRGYEEAMRRAGLVPAPVVEVPFDASDIDARLETVFGAEDRPTALFCSTDLIALSVVGAAARLGIEVPRDLSVVGFDGIGIGAAIRPQLTTVVQPTADMGREAFSLLTRLMQSPSNAALRKTRLLPYAIRPGETVAPTTP